MSRMEVLEALKRQIDNLMLSREPHSDFEAHLQNGLAVLISVVVEQERVLLHLCPDKSDDI
jgi:hypothetical protein